MLTSRLWGWLCPSEDLTALSQYEQELRAGDGERDRTDAKVGRLGNRSCEPRIRLGTKCSFSSTPSCSVLLAGFQGARAVPSMGHSVSASALSVCANRLGMGQAAESCVGSPTPLAKSKLIECLPPGQETGLHSLWVWGTAFSPGQGPSVQGHEAEAAEILQQKDACLAHGQLWFDPWNAYDPWSATRSDL